MQQSKMLTRPAPTKGLNAFDGIGFMPEGYALTLRNMFAQPYGCQVRRGYVQHCVGLGGEVESLMSHNTGASPKLYAMVTDGVVAAHGPYHIQKLENPLHRGVPDADPVPTAMTATMYDVTAANAAGVSKITGLSNARWQHANFPNPAGVFLVACNGADNPIVIDPTSAIHRLAAGDGTNYTISGVNPAVWIQCYSHQKRLWFVEKDSTQAWYLPPDQLFGTATGFNPGANWTRGGKLVQIITWTIDDGNGADDHIAFISSEGEVSIYQGLDPDDATTWGLQGVYFAGAPVSGNRVATRYGGDIFIITQFGTVYLSDLLKSTKINPGEANTGKYVQQSVSNAVTLHGNQFGWQPFIFPGANMIIVNVPNTDTTSFQYVQNDITKAWSEFLGYEANCWELHDQKPFYGSFGAVYRAWERATDNCVVQNDGTYVPGADIRWESLTTFSFFNEGPNQKQFHMVRPNIVSEGQFSISFSTNVNFSFNAPLSPASFQSYVPGKWDEGLWDVAVWAGGLRTFMQWLGAEGVGINAAIRMLGRSSSETYWASVDWLYENGGVL